MIELVRFYATLCATTELPKSTLRNRWDFLPPPAYDAFD
jgi:hypothetical protein